MAKIQIIIPCINLWNKYTKPCFDSVMRALDGLPYQDFRILLIDNGSTDETKEEASRFVSNQFSHKRNEDRWSCSKSWNYGINDAFERGFDYDLVLNNDILLHPHSIKQLIDCFEYHPQNKVMVTMMNVRGECETPDKIFTLDYREKFSCPETEHPDFSGFMISKKCWNEVGEFDEGFDPAYYEDNDYHYRINLSGNIAVVFPPAMFYHFGSGTQNEALGNGKKLISGSNCMNYYLSKWGGLPGKEEWKSPFNNNPSLDYKYTKQSKHE